MEVKENWADRMKRVKDIELETSELETSELETSELETSELETPDKNLYPIEFDQIFIIHSDSIYNKRYIQWKNVYRNNLSHLFNIMKSLTKEYKVSTTRRLDFESFAKFAYINSSKYISPYV